MIREKESSELFTIDVEGDAAAAKKLSKHITKRLKADEILAQRSAVPAVSMRKRAGENTTNGLIPAKRVRSDWVTQKDLARLRRVADGQHDTTIEVKDATYDPWAPPVEEPSDPNEPKKAPVKQPKSMKRAPISLTADGKRVAAVQKPRGGYSYNPVFADYEERLATESEKVLEAERKRLEDEEADRLRQEAAARSAAEADAAQERAQLSEWEEDSEWEGFQSGVEDFKPSAKRPERKTLTQRKRIQRRKEDEQLAKDKAALKAHRTQGHRIKELVEELNEKIANKELVPVQTVDSDTDSEADDTNLRRRQLGKFKLPEKDLELVLPDELQESLRLLKPEGNLLKDRYRSMLVRGKVESRRHIPFKRQAKKKFTEKWTHKDFVL